MAGNKFKNAAAKLLAEHSVKPDKREEKSIYEAAAKKPDIAVSPEPKREAAPMNPEMFAQRRSKDFPVPKPVMAQQNKPVGQSAMNAEMVTSLIQYIIVILLALLGYALAGFADIAPIMGIGGKMIGLVGGAVLGLIIAIWLKNS